MKNKRGCVVWVSETLIIIQVVLLGLKLGQFGNAGEWNVWAVLIPLYLLIFLWCSLFFGAVLYFLMITDSEALPEEDE